MLGEEDEDPREFNWIKFAGKGLVEYANGESYDGSFNSEKMVHAGPLCRSSPLTAARRRSPPPPATTATTATTATAAASRTHARNCILPHHRLATSPPHRLAASPLHRFTASPPQKHGEGTYIWMKENEEGEKEEKAKYVEQNQTKRTKRTLPLCPRLHHEHIVASLRSR